MNIVVTSTSKPSKGVSLFSKVTHKAHTLSNIKQAEFSHGSRGEFEGWVEWEEAGGKMGKLLKRGECSCVLLCRALVHCSSKGSELQVARAGKNQWSKNG